MSDQSDQDQPEEPTPAQRARSVLAAATSLTVTTPGHVIELIGLHSVDETGQLTLEDPTGGHVTAELAATSGQRLGAVVELTDVAPVAVRDRVRARVTLEGRLTSRNQDRLLFRPTAVALETADGTTHLEFDEFTAAEPDPLTAYEAKLLTHLDTAHTETVTVLSRLAPPRLLLSVTRVRAVRLDQYGLVLRLEHAHTHEDVRLLFAGPARTPNEAAAQIGLLSARAATHCARRTRR
ncbi:DUF2470 domain-containing protein [Streptomyces spongiae]|uniref:DUF2470 domain-containing protein n=1 Tax=Streptomyces spongiae TaxID=565072 RepID=A0A5N8XI96_9ACTN|nr:DUF2470 domain-containing protein [Streptomyces spongiae]MPY59192.1 DUF2470 domain-containing protein [Streptomyces spongiae]